jgi:phospholipid/cholesterol/gamma-HCH transport system ATP-binding protein
MGEWKSQPVLCFENVSVIYDGVPVLDRVSFDMRQGETAIILGAAGSGKTVLMKSALGLVRADAGRIYVFGEDITHLEEERLFEIRSRMGMLFQEGGLFDSLTIKENVAYPLLNQKGSRSSPEETHERVVETLRFVELDHTLEKFPSELSGGMRRRVGIARAVVTRPPLVLYDSPTAGLDPITSFTIMSLIAKERDLNNVTTVIVTHRYQDGDMMANFRYNPKSGSLERVLPGGADHGFRTRFMVLKEGALIFDGPQEEFEASADPYVAKFVKREI